MRARRSSSQGHNNSAPPQFVQPIRPICHHLDALCPILSAGVSLSDRVGLDMGELRFDGIGVPLATFVR